MNVERNPIPSPQEDAERAADRFREPSAPAELPATHTPEQLRVHIEETVDAWTQQLTQTYAEQSLGPMLKEKQVDALASNVVAGLLHLRFNGGDEALKTRLSDKGVLQGSALAMQSDGMRFIVESAKLALLRYGLEARNAAGGAMAATEQTRHELDAKVADAAKEYVPKERAMELLKQAPQGAPVYRSFALDRLFAVARNADIRAALQETGAMDEAGIWHLESPAARKMIQDTIETTAKRVPNMKSGEELADHVEQSLRFIIGRGGSANRNVNRPTAAGM
ncbi:MAG: hypothetical protein Q7S96_03735 [bacterium]|nr:hypothetical protein [bacterium]